jgi:hypothetical protein
MRLFEPSDSFIVVIHIDLPHSLFLRVNQISIVMDRIVTIIFDGKIIHIGLNR